MNTKIFIEVIEILRLYGHEVLADKVEKEVSEINNFLDIQMKNKLNLTWKDVLDNKLGIAGTPIEKYAESVYKTGYKYFSWNGFVHELYKMDTGVLVIHNTNINIKGL